MDFKIFKNPNDNGGMTLYRETSNPPSDAKASGTTDWSLFAILAVLAVVVYLAVETSKQSKRTARILELLETQKGEEVNDKAA